MPVSPNNLQFSLASEYLERLKEKANTGESLGLTAKRILIAALDDERECIPSTDLTDIEKRLIALEMGQTNDRSDIAFVENIVKGIINQMNPPIDKQPTGLSALDEYNLSIAQSDIAMLEIREREISNRLSNHEAHTQQFAFVIDRLNALEADRQDLTALTDRITAIEVAIDCEHFPPEKVSDRLTAIESALAEIRSQIGEATSPVKRPASPPPPRSRKK